jgi:hypothetical protein
MSCSESDDGSDAGKITLADVCHRYRQASFDEALHRTLDFRRAASELADVYVLAPTASNKRISKAVLDLLYQDTLTAISCCDGYVVLPRIVSWRAC